MVVHIFEICTVVKPPNYCLSEQFGRFYGNASEVRAPWIIHCLVTKSMVYRIIVNVKDYLLEVYFTVDQFSIERTFKQCTMFSITLVKCLSVSIKELLELEGKKTTPVFVITPDRVQNPVRGKFL